MVDTGKALQMANEKGLDLVEVSLVFGKQTFTWKTLDAAAGNYFVGFVVEDLDGNRQQSLIRITVK